MNGIERSIGSGNPQRNAAAEPLAARARAAPVARFSPVEWILLAAIVVLPTAFIWHFASQGYFLWDDFHNLYWAQNTPSLLPYLFGATYGDHLSPAHRLGYLVLQRVAPLNFDVAVAGLLTCHAASAVLLQRILTLLFARAWWTYALALAWAMSAVYVAGFMWFAAALHSIPAITATLASIHGYLCWHASGRRAWLWWSFAAMCIGLAFYLKALLIPLYLVLIRLIMDPGPRLRDSLRSVCGEWRVWLASAMVCVLFIGWYLIGGYPGHPQPESNATVGGILHYLRVFWFEGFWPMLFGVRVPLYDHTVWHQVVIVAAQVGLLAVAVWSIIRRRAAWRAWAFLLVAVGANALIVTQRVSQFGAEYTAYSVRYYLEPTLLFALAIGFAFATLRVTPRGFATNATNPVEGPPRTASSRGDATSTGFRTPTVLVGTAVLVALAAYTAASWVTSGGLAKRSPGTPEVLAAQAGRLTNTYFENLRTDLASIRGAGVEPSLVDHNVPETVVSRFTNLKPAALQAGVRYSLLSSLVPLFDDEVKFNQPGHMFVVRPDGHLERTRFVSVAGGSPTELRRGGRLRREEARIEEGQDEVCGVSEGVGALEWNPRPRLRGHDWWLRVRYRTDPIEPTWLETDGGDGWIYEGFKLPAMGRPGRALVDLSERKEGVPTNAGVRLGIPILGQLCLRSLEIGYLDPPVPAWNP